MADDERPAPLSDRADVPVRLTLYLSRAQVRAGWGRSRVQLLRAIRLALFELAGDDGGRYSPRVVFEEEQTPGIVRGPALKPPGAEVYSDDEPPPDKLDAGLAEAEYHAALDNLNAIRAEKHLTGWAPRHLWHHLIADHGIDPSLVPRDDALAALDEVHAAAHKLEGGVT